jgi:hypothetical protein
MNGKNAGTVIHDANSNNYVGTDPLPRDRTQSMRLHEPTWIRSTIDPITGRDIRDPAMHPYVVDCKVKMYFESEETRQAYLETPTDHPLRLIDNPTDEGWDEG